MRVDQLTDTDKRALASQFWHGAHHNGEPLTWSDMSVDEQRDAASRFKVKANADDALMRDLLPKTLAALDTCLRGLSVLAKQSGTMPKELARAMAREVKRYAVSRVELDDALARLERLQSANIRSIEAQTLLLETLDARIGQLERRLP